MFKIGDYVRILTGPRAGMIGEITATYGSGMYVHPFYMYPFEVEYVSPEEVLLYKLENA